MSKAASPSSQLPNSKKKLLDCTGSFDRKSAFCAFAPGRHFQSFISWYVSDIKLFVKLCKTPVEQEDLVGAEGMCIGGMVKRWPEAGTLALDVACGPLHPPRACVQLGEAVGFPAADVLAINLWNFVNNF